MSQDYLVDKGYRVVCLREPGSTPVAEKIRLILLDRRSSISDITELLLYEAARAEIVRHEIEPLLSTGHIVLCDRFYDSTTAYQGYGRGFDLELVNSLHRLGTAGRWPDLTLLLDLDIDSMRRRGQMRLETLLVQDRLEDESRRFHETVRRGYLEIARAEPDRVKIVDATAEADLIHRRIMEYVDRAIAQRS